jgi:DNA processing protein
VFAADDWLRLACCPGVGSAAAGRLLREELAPEGVELLRRRVRDAVREEEVAALRRACAAAGVGVLTPADPAWPPRLREIHDPPPALYVRGDPALLRQPQLAVVGARRASRRGLSDAGWLARGLARAGLGVTSGLALGIDGAAHRAALDAGGATVAVLGAGVDVPYPRIHAALAEAVARRGLLVSEWPPGTRPARHHFPRRNRLISGLSLGVIVVEAGDRSGSLITARLAAEQGREVFALPATARDPGGAGCHRLIREGAVLVRDLEDVFAELPEGFRPQRCAGPPREPAPRAAVPDDPVLAALDAEGTSMEALLARTGLAVPALAARLTELELDGRVAREGERIVPLPPAPVGSV